nr:XRE family transcriptional regulator [uncultured Peptostreptococcus sp.]
MYLSSNLKFLRKQSGFSQDHIANLLGYKSFTTIQKWESGISEPSISTVQKLCELYNVSMSEILYTKLSSNDKSITESTRNTDLYEYKYFPVSISAGSLENIDSIQEYELISLSDKILGKYARSKNIILLKINGESMNNIIPNGSYIIVDASRNTIHDIKDRDIVVFSENGSYSVKRYINDSANQRILFKPDSTDDTFTAIEVKYENSENLRLIGKVVKYIVNLD